MNLAHHNQTKPIVGIARFIIVLAVAFLLTILLSAFRQTSEQSIVTDEGERVFNQVCAVCHQIDMPASMEDGKPLAPPMKMILMRYQMTYDSTSAIESALTTWLEKPDPERSALPAHAIEEHGLMPPLTITETERKAVVTYLLTLVGEGGMGEMEHNMNGMMNHDMNGKMDHDMERKKGKMKHDMNGKKEMKGKMNHK